MLLAIYPSAGIGGSEIFPRGCSTFNDRLNNAVRVPEFRDYLHAKGIPCNDLGTHSYRKGCATWVAGGRFALFVIECLTIDYDSL